MQKVRLTTDKYVDYFKAVAKKIAAEKEYITQLDAATGDGDHWINMNTGFTKLLEKESALRSSTLSSMFRTVAFIIMSGVGGFCPHCPQGLSDRMTTSAIVSHPHPGRQFTEWHTMRSSKRECPHPW